MTVYSEDGRGRGNGMESMAHTRYIYTRHDTKTLPVDWDASMNWDAFEAACRESGFDPEDEEIGAGYLTEPWNGHDAGALILSGCTVEGFPFVVFGERRRV